MAGPVDGEAPGGGRAQIAQPAQLEDLAVGEDTVDVVGESNYQEALAVVATMEPLPPAMLVPEDDNRFDDQAVRVDIAGRTVGYLGRDDARSFRRRLARAKLAGCITSCEAEVRGGHTLRDGQAASYGVALYIKAFD